MIPVDLKMTLDEGARASRRRSREAYAEGPEGQGARRHRAPARGPDAPRLASTPPGVVIAPQPIDELRAALQDEAGDEITTQCDMKDVERLGLLKMDFLGLRTLTVIDDTLKMIEAQPGHRRSTSSDLPLDDAGDLRAVLRRARRSGIFQFESAGMRDLLRRVKPDRFEDLTAFNALYRPGPLGGMVDDFIKRKHGQKRGQLRAPGARADPATRPTASSSTRSR